MRVPVVAPDLWGMRMYFGPDALVYYRPGDAADLADKILAALEDEGLRASVAARAADVYDEVRWERTSEVYLGVVRNLVGEG